MIRYVQAAKGQAKTIKEHLPFVCPDVNYIEKMLSSSEAIVVLAKDNDAIVGVEGGWTEETPSGYNVEDRTLREHEAFYEAHLDWIAVREEYRVKGIGSALIEKVCDWAKEKDKNKIWTEVAWKEGDFDTVAFHRKLGFKEIGCFRDMKGEEYVTMLKQL